VLLLFCADLVKVYNALGTPVQTIMGLANSGFGTTVATAEDYVVIGSPADSSSQGIGSVSLYTIADCSSLSLVTTVRGSAMSQFGAAVTANGDVVAVGSVDTSNGGYYTTVYIYAFNGTALNLIQSTTLEKTVSASRYSSSLSLYGDLLAVGDYTYGSQNGAVFVLANVNATGTANFTLIQVRSCSHHNLVRIPIRFLGILCRLLQVWLSPASWVLLFLLPMTLWLPELLV
jgi:hypothetical protein